MAFVRLEGSDIDWFDGAVEFPVLPPMRSTIRVMDRNANFRTLKVKDIAIGWIRSKLRDLLPKTISEPTITLICSELSRVKSAKQP